MYLISHLLDIAVHKTGNLYLHAAALRLYGLHLEHLPVHGELLLHRSLGRHHHLKHVTPLRVVVHPLRDIVVIRLQELGLRRVELAPYLAQLVVQLVNQIAAHQPAGQKLHAVPVQQSGSPGLQHAERAQCLGVYQSLLPEDSQVLGWYVGSRRQVLTGQLRLACPCRHVQSYHNRVCQYVHSIPHERGLAPPALPSNPCTLWPAWA